MIAGHDPERIVSLERGPVRVYWDIAHHHMSQLLAEKKRIDNANRKRHGR
jgi:hypothetical protein